MNLGKSLEKVLDSTHLDLIRRIAADALEFGFSMYLVGGSVRDLLLGRPIVDVDLTMEGDAIELGRALVKKHGGELTTHDKFFTATWTPQSSNSQILDLVSARKEIYTHPGALPTVIRSTIDDDLRRRDFTINAMAIRLDGDHFGELHDPLGGQNDLQRKLIRFLHKRSFVEDPTRMFRAARYSMRYQFDLESETAQALRDTDARKVLSQLSGERLRHEFDLIFEEERPLLALAVLDDGWGLIKVVHPALETGRAMALSYLKDPSHDFGEFVVPDMLSFRQSLGWVQYLQHLTESEIDSVAERLAFPALLTRSVRAASALYQELPRLKGSKPSQWTSYLDELPSLSVYAVYLVSRESALSDYLSKWQRVKPMTTGDDLKARGLEPGPRFGEILRRLRAAWLDGEVKTEEEEILFLEKWTSSYSG